MGINSRTHCDDCKFIAEITRRARFQRREGVQCRAKSTTPSIRTGNKRRKVHDDHTISIGFGQTISQPYVVVLMSEALNLQHGDRVLEIGTGFGYQSTTLAEWFSEVYTFEIVQALGERTRTLLRDLGCENADIRIRNGLEGWNEKSLFDAGHRGPASSTYNC